ncbi:MAG: hypothetical protein OXS47_00265 [Chloroflexota bacterium]|nr:hypothetical protein [Chloroflexota bacterium]
MVLSPITVNAETGEQTWEGKDQGLCFCGRTREEHEDAFMAFYLFGDTANDLFSEGATSLSGIYSDHYAMALKYLSTSEFVLFEHRKYFAKQLASWMESSDEFSESLSRSFEVARLARQRAYASCPPRSRLRVWLGHVGGRVLNGTHRHAFYEAALDQRCRGCGAGFPYVHDLGREEDMTAAAVLKLGGRSWRRPVYPLDYCARCGSIPQPFWVSRGTRRLTTLFRTLNRGLGWSWVHLRKPNAVTITAFLLGAVLTTVGWWLF